MIWARYYNDQHLVGYVPVYDQEEMREMATKKEKELAAKRSAAAKKAAATRARNKAAREAAVELTDGEASYNADAVAEDNVYYVVMERGILSAKARSLHSTRDVATALAASLENQSMAPYNKFVVQRVELTS